MKLALALLLAALPLAAAADTAPAGSSAGRVVGVLSGDRVIASSGASQFICKIGEDGADAYKLTDCKVLDVSVPAPADDMSRLVQVFEQYGCRMTEQQAMTVLPSLGFDKDKTQGLVEQLRAEGRMELSGDTAILKSENCK